jgi:DNA-binding transcriptional MerR regulator
MAAEQDLYFISVAARMLGMHPQTLRKYERLGLVQPTRTIGSMRLYSRDELERLKLIKRLVDDSGINLAGSSRSAQSFSACGPSCAKIRYQLATRDDASLRNSMS